MLIAEIKSCVRHADALGRFGAYSVLPSGSIHIPRTQPCLRTDIDDIEFEDGRTPEWLVFHACLKVVLQNTIGTDIISRVCVLLTYTSSQESHMLEIPNLNLIH